MKIKNQSNQTQNKKILKHKNKKILKHKNKKILIKIFFKLKSINNKTLKLLKQRKQENINKSIFENGKLKINQNH